MRLRVKDIIRLLLEFFILTIIFLTPIYFALFPRGANVFELPKMVLFKILVLLLLLFTIIKFLLFPSRLSQTQRWEKGWPPDVTSGGRGVLSKFLYPLFFLLILSLSTLLSPWPELSFYGTYGRQMGLVSYIYFFLFFVLLLANINARLPADSGSTAQKAVEPLGYIRVQAQIERVIKAAVLGSVVVCAYGLVQAAGQDPLHWIESTRLRITSTFGQPNILAAYLLLVIPLSAYLIWQTRKWWTKAIYFLIFASQILTLFFTYSFSGWLGLIGGVIISGIILLFYSHKAWKSDVKSPLKRSQTVRKLWKTLFALAIYKNKWLILATKNSKGSLTPFGMTVFGQSGGAEPRVCGVVPSCLSRPKRREEGWPPDVTSGGRGVFLFLKKKTLTIILFVLLLFIPLIFGFNLYKRQPWVLRDKIHYLLHPTTGSLSARADFWRASLAAIKKRPLLGYGPDTQGEALLSYYEKDWATVNKVNVRPNRAHNLFLDILLTSGILGLIAFLALLYAFFKMLWQNVKNNNSRALNIAIFFALLSYLIYLMFNFSSVTTEIYFWFYFALAVVMSSILPFQESEEQKTEILGMQKLVIPRSEATRDPFELKAAHLNDFSSVSGENKMRFLNFFTIIKKSPLGRQPFSQRYIMTSIKIILIILIAAGILWQANREVKALAADHYWYALRNVRWVDNDFFASWVLFNYIKDLNIRDDYYQKQYALMLANWVPNLDQYGLIFRRVAKERILPTILPILKTGQTYNDYLVRGKVYTFLASEQQPKYYQLAQDNLEKLINLSSNRPRPYLELARFLTKKGDWEEAEDNYRLALTKLPDFSNPRLDADHKKNVENEIHLIYYGLGNLYSEKRDYKKAIEYYKLAQNYNQYNLSVLRALARAYHQQGDIEQAIWYNKKGMEATPDYDWSWPLALTRLYNELGDKEKTRQYAEKVLEFYPQNQEAKELAK